MTNAPIQDVPRPAPDEVVRGAVSRLLLGDGRMLEDAKALLEHYGQALREDGVPVDRIFIVFPTLHPQVRAISYVWSSDGSATQEILRGWGFGDEFQRSPMARIFDKTYDVIRRRVCDPTVPRDFGVVEDLSARGFTDYLAAAMAGAYQRHTPTTVTFSTRHPGGFSDDALERCLASLPLLAPLIDTYVMARVAGSLLNVYLGAGAGARVLNGSVRRGDGENIPAVVCFTDLRDFTTLSDQLPREVLLELLNGYFDCVVGAVQQQGGEVLKFIGDAVLAVFRVQPGEEQAASAAALAAAHDAFSRAAAANTARTEGGKHPIAFGMSIHVGEVMYGNIGGPDRLDFTVIGPAVNVSSRIQGLCRTLGKDLLVSEAFMAAAHVDAEDLGVHQLKGVAQPLRIFSPRVPRLASDSG